MVVEKIVTPSEDLYHRGHGMIILAVQIITVLSKLIIEIK